jgi:protein-S-isoprenylcysteine O-methyltransferase Ste14
MHFLKRWNQFIGADNCKADNSHKEVKMHLLDQKILGIAILLLLGMLVTVKQVATGSILDQPKGNFMVQVVNVFNLFFLLVVNPLSAILLITDRLPKSDPTHIAINQQWITTILEIVGLVFGMAGYLLMAWALITLGRNYQLGGSTPRSEDRMVFDGPYRLIRHPMYSAALSISLGMAFLIQSGAFIGVFFIYLVLITPLIVMEEKALRGAYGDQYRVYQQKTRKLIPYIY